MKRIARRRWAIEADADVDSGKLEAAAYQRLAEKVLDAYPN